MDRLMGLDVGDRTIGVAVSDLLMITAQGVTTIKRNGYKNDFLELEKIIKDYDVEKAVIGFPKNMNNTIGPQGEKVLEFVEVFKERLNLEVILEDERLSTVSAERALIEVDMSRKKRKTVIDKIAATYILQLYLDKMRRC